jgi:hypothetical protein
MPAVVTCVGFLFFYQCEVPKPEPIDSYCASYQRVIQQKGEGAIAASLAVKQRLAANEITYRCLCEKWQSPLCKK